MKKWSLVLICSLMMFASCAQEKSSPISDDTNKAIEVGAAQFDEYLHLLTGKEVGLVVNQTSVVHNKHLVDTLLQRGIQIEKVFAPEHGFRGTADAGEKVQDGVDQQTGLPIISLYGKNRKPSPEQLSSIDVLVFDIQDVGARFYTYISTLEYVMEACAEQQIPFIVLDRPNPNGHYVDGPVLQEEMKSFVGMQPIPVVHGMTVGEYAHYLNGEKRLKNGVQADLTVIKTKNYTHQSRYELPIAPSPNLPNQQSILLYPSLCFFEGTTVSVGRGTDKQFQIYGSPELNGPYQFTPVSMPGATYPKHQSVACNGYDLSTVPQDSLYHTGQLQLQYVIKAYEQLKANGEDFFLNNHFFDKLAGTKKLRKQIEAGLSEEEIRASWKEDLEAFLQIRKNYLLYDDATLQE